MIIRYGENSTLKQVYATLAQQQLPLFMNLNDRQMCEQVEAIYIELVSNDYNI